MLIGRLTNEIIKAIKVITSVLGNIGLTWLFKMLHVG
jgi:hypothetical protein